MKDSDKERLSSLVDADPELSSAARQALLDRLRAEPELRATWTRYHLIGDALRNGLEAAPDRDLAADVRRAVDAEPVPLFARPARKPRTQLSPWMGLAAAASVAAIALVVVPGDGGPGSDPADVSVAARPVIEPAASPVSAVAGSAAALGTTAVAATRMRWSAKQPTVEARLNGYLVNHSAYAGNSVRGGMLPYVRIVGYEGQGASAYRQ